MNRSEFIKTYSSVAIATAKDGLLPSIIMAQAILESNNGNSTLAKDYNNFFGIKADASWTGARVELNTREEYQEDSYYIDDYFRAYDTAYDSFLDRYKFLKENPRYAGVFESKTPDMQALALQNGGYATAYNYANTLVQIINDNNLTDLDKKRNIMKTAAYATAIIMTLLVIITWYKTIKY